MENLQVRIEKMPEGQPKASDFGIHSGPIPEPDDGEILVRTRYLALDPYIRVMMNGRHFLGQPSVGDVMRSRSVAEVVESRNPSFRVGERLLIETGMQQYCVTNGEGAQRFNIGDAPESTVLGVLGMPGFTSYCGLTQVGQLLPGQTVLVSAASGAVGGMVGQIAVQMGAKAIGIAGSDEKCRWAIDNFGFEDCVNYKTEAVSERLKALRPDGYDIYFDNMGGDILDTVVANHLGMGARIVLCGLITQYNNPEKPPGPNLAPLMGARASILPLIVYDFEHLWDEFQSKARNWYAGGAIRYREEVGEGLEAAPGLFAKLMRGENFGKTLIHNPWPEEIAAT